VCLCPVTPPFLSFLLCLSIHATTLVLLLILLTTTYWYHHYHHYHLYHQVRVFNKSGTAIAAQWSSDAAAWVEIGEVTGSGGSSDGGEVHGVVYDHIMPVEIETAQGLVTLQLGYNDLENPFISAQRFLDQNQLDQNYLSQIADFITARSGKPSAPTFDMSSGASSSSSSSSSSGSGSGHPMEVDMVDNQDTSASSKRARHNYTLLPLQVYFSYEDIPSGLQTKFMTKIRDFNSAFAAAGGDARGVLPEADLLVIEDTLGVLANTSHYHSSRVPKNIYAVINVMLSHWTDGKTLFPSFDLLRMIAAHPSGSHQLAASPYLPAMLARSVSEVCQDFSGGGAAELTDSSAPLSSPQALTALRFLASSCRHPPLRQKVLGLVLTPQTDSAVPFGAFSTLIATLGALSSSKTIKSIHRHALASWCANVLLACCVGEDSLSSEAVKSSVLAVYYPSVVFLLDEEADNVEVVVRCLLALGTVAVSSSLAEQTKAGLQSTSLVESVLTAVRERWSGRATDYVELCLSEVMGAVHQQ
jgi:hypothetical protein